MLNVGVIGYGYWGPNLVRNFNEIESSQVVGLCDLNPKNLAKAAARYPGLKTYSDYRELVNSEDIQAIAVATPVATHYEFGMAALKAGKHLLMEKPLAASAQEGEKLIEEAEKRSLTLMIDHTFIYTGAVRKIKEYIDSGVLGKIHYYDSVRINLGLFQSDVDVLWDLAVHDLAILGYLLGKAPVSAMTSGGSHISGQQPNLAYLTLNYDDGFIAHMNVNWLAPVKIRRTIIGGAKKMVVYDDLEPSEKIKVYDKGVDLADPEQGAKELKIGYRSGDMFCPKIELTEALRTMAIHFIESITNKTRPLTDGRDGLTVLKILEAASRSLEENGQKIRL